MEHYSHTSNLVDFEATAKGISKMEELQWVDFYLWYPKNVKKYHYIS